MQASDLLSFQSHSNTRIQVLLRYQMCKALITVGLM